MITTLPSVSKQSGAALVVALILLIAITLMAISSMNTATLDLIMAGNEQFRGRAFTAAESGIEVAWKNDSAFTSSVDFPVTTPASTGIGNDKFSYSVTRPLGSVIGPVANASSFGLFGAVYWAIQATGTSERGAQAATAQGLYETVKTDDSQTYTPGLCLGTADLDAPTSSC